ncbi:MAG: hypothetical protein IJJ84_14665 [Kiritimatiellae bacterium]|nr:hypothetical protein [Kiritimatiellia bacterium]
MKRVMVVSMALAAALPLAAAEAGEKSAGPTNEEEYISVVTGKPVPKDGKFTVEQIKARDERVLKKTGGFIHLAAEGPQTLLVDARAKPTATLDEVARVYKLATHLDAQVAKEARGDVPPLEFAKAKMSAAKPLMLVMVVDGGPGQPILSVFPEERVGIVNADKLKGGEDPSAPEMRVMKETWRAIGFVGGLGFSPAENDIMQPLYSLKELDANRYPFIQPMNMARMYKMWKRFGVKKERRIPYRVAVQEGWAAQPTNDYQKAVWEQVKAEKERGPTNPITIPPPNAKK